MALPINLPTDAQAAQITEGGEHQGVPIPTTQDPYWALEIARAVDQALRDAATPLKCWPGKAAPLNADDAGDLYPLGVCVAPGVVKSGSTYYEYAGSGATPAVTVTDDATTCVWAAISSGAAVIASGSAWPGTAHKKLCKATAADGAITDLIDYRFADPFVVA